MKKGKFTVEDFKAAYYADKIREYCLNFSECDGCIFYTSKLKDASFCQLRQSTPAKWITTRR